MLVLSRKAGEQVTIGNAITLTVVAISGKTVRIGVEAPDDVRILRAELNVWRNGSIRNENLRDRAKRVDLQIA
jgi:carbon storage regulator CsrA